MEKDAAGSRPKELFEDVLEEVEAGFEKDRTILKVHAEIRTLDQHHRWRGRNDSTSAAGCESGVLMACCKWT